MNKVKFSKYEDFMKMERSLSPFSCENFIIKDCSGSMMWNDRENHAKDVVEKLLQNIGPEKNALLMASGGYGIQEKVDIKFEYNLKYNNLVSSRPDRLCCVFNCLPAIASEGDVYELDGNEYRIVGLSSNSEELYAIMDYRLGFELKSGELIKKSGKGDGVIKFNGCRTSLGNQIIAFGFKGLKKDVEYQFADILVSGDSSLSLNKDYVSSFNENCDAVLKYDEKISSNVLHVKNSVDEEYKLFRPFSRNDRYKSKVIKYEKNSILVDDASGFFARDRIDITDGDILLPYLEILSVDGNSITVVDNNLMVPSESRNLFIKHSSQLYHRSCRNSIFNVSVKSDDGGSIVFYTIGFSGLISEWDIRTTKEWEFLDFLWADETYDFNMALRDVQGYPVKDDIVLSFYTEENNLKGAAKNNSVLLTEDAKASDVELLVNSVDGIKIKDELRISNGEFFQDIVVENINDDRISIFPALNHDFNLYDSVILRKGAREDVDSLFRVNSQAPISSGSKREFDNAVLEQKTAFVGPLVVDDLFEFKKEDNTYDSSLYISLPLEVKNGNANGEIYLQKLFGFERIEKGGVTPYHDRNTFYGKTYSIYPFIENYGFSLKPFNVDFLLPFHMYSSIDIVEDNIEIKYEMFYKNSMIDGARAKVKVYRIKNENDLPVKENCCFVSGIDHIDGELFNKNKYLSHFANNQDKYEIVFDGKMKFSKGVASLKKCIKSISDDYLYIVEACVDNDVNRNMESKMHCFDIFNINGLMGKRMARKGFAKVKAFSANVNKNTDVLFGIFPEGNELFYNGLPCKHSEEWFLCNLSRSVESESLVKINAVVKRLSGSEYKEVDDCKIYLKSNILKNKVNDLFLYIEAFCLIDGKMYRDDLLLPVNDSSKCVSNIHDYFINEGNVEEVSAALDKNGVAGYGRMDRALDEILDKISLLGHQKYSLWIISDFDMNDQELGVFKGKLGNLSRFNVDIRLISVGNIAVKI